MKQTYLIQSLKNPLKIGPPNLFCKIAGDCCWIWERRVIDPNGHLYFLFYARTSFTLNHKYIKSSILNIILKYAFSNLTR